MHKYKFVLYISILCGIEALKGIFSIWKEGSLSLFQNVLCSLRKCGGWVQVRFGGDATCARYPYIPEGH